MDEDLFQQIVQRVIARLAERLGADGSRGTVIAVYTGATVGFAEAVEQMRLLILDGFRVRLAFSPAAEALFGNTIRNQLAGFPHVSAVPAETWLSTLKDAEGVVVPLFSVNTLSKLSMLMADSLPTNLILHALFMGKPVVAARDGADPGGAGRAALGFHKGAAALERALLERFQTVAEYGCRLVDVNRLRDTLVAAVRAGKPSGQAVATATSSRRVRRLSGKVVSAADVLHARRLGVDLELAPGCIVTPLARDFAREHGVLLSQAGER